MELQPKDILKTFRMRRIMLPIIIGLGVTAWLIISNLTKPIFIKSEPGKGQYEWVDKNHDKHPQIDEFIPAENGDYVKVTYKDTITSINWTTSFTVIMLWEFASAVMPALLGGGFVFAVFILNREKVNMGKSITAVMLSSFLDGLFFAIVAPAVYWLAGKDKLFSSVNPDTIQSLTFGQGLYYFFWLVYFCILAYKLLIAYALFVNPRSVKRLLVKIFTLPFLKRWKSGAMETGNQLMVASNELKTKHFWFWFNSFGATFITWTARFSIVNCIIIAFHDVQFSQILTATRQIIPIDN